jgi:hypothetical protein
VQDPTASKDDIGQGRINMGGALNNCGLAEHTFSSNGQYQGATHLYANIDSNGNCTGNFPDGQNTVSWEHFDKPDLLASTCWRDDGLGGMAEADIAIGSDRGIVDSLPSGCSNSYDLQTILTHEWGHAYGLAHETQGGDEVMFPTATPCAYRRHLGRGDWYGMKNLYG